MTGQGQDMAVAANRAAQPRWQRTFQSAETFTDDLGSIGAWVGPRAGPGKRTHGEMEDYIFRRLLVAWKETERLRFPLDAYAETDRKGEPDFVLKWADGKTLGVEVTQACDENYQAWLTRTEADREASRFVGVEPVGPSVQKAVDEILEAIRRKTESYVKGAYREPEQCDLAIYDMTGRVYDLQALQEELHRCRSNISTGSFGQIQLVKDATVFLDLFGDNERVDVGQTYEIDYANWIFNQVDRMRHGSTDELDFALIAEELESLGKSERKALASHLRNLLLHFLKWQFQPGRRGQSWRLSIDNARSEIFELLTEMPSLRHEFYKRIASEYGRARRTAAIETELDLATFPEECPYSREQIVDPDFYPGDEA